MVKVPEYLEEEYTAALKEREERIKITITPAEIRENEKRDSIFQDAMIREKSAAADEETNRIIEETRKLKTTFERDFEREGRVRV